MMIKHKTLRLFLLIAAFSLRLAHAQSTLSKKIDDYINIRLAESHLPGLALAVVHRDTVILAKGYGVTSDKSLVTANSPFAIASLSKAFTAMAVMQLVEAGKVNIDSPVIKYLPQFKISSAARSKITVSQLLHQTGGLSDKGYPELTFKTQPNSLDELMIRLKTARLVSEPGKQFHYHNPNYEILAKLVETVSGEKFSDYLQGHIFKPLGMNDTRDVSSTSSFYNPSNGLSNGHIFFLGKPIIYHEPEWFVDGAAGVVSSANDMAHWLSMQIDTGRFNDKILLNRRNITLMQTTAPGTKVNYGMGWFITGDSSLYHSGILWTYSSEQMIIPKNGYGIVVLFNGGFNAFVDYYSFLQGITDIVNNREPEHAAISTRGYEIIAGITFVISLAFPIRRLSRLKQWHQIYQRRSKWQSWLYMALRLVPFILVIFIPQLVTILSGRVLSWERIFLMAPDIIVGLASIAVINLALILRRLAYFSTRNRALKS